MSAQAVAKELARLSYSDMMLFVSKLASQVDITASREHLANVLASLANEFEAKPDTTDNKSNELLRKCFSSRVKTIRVQPLANGWEVSAGSTKAAGERLPDALNLLLDTLITHKAMGVG